MGLQCWVLEPLPVTSSETLSLSYAHEEDDANSPAVPTLGSELWLEVVAATT